MIIRREPRSVSEEYSWDRPPKPLTRKVAVFIAATGLALTLHANTDPAESYRLGFSGYGSCLSGTAYDPAAGAQTSTSTILGETVMTVDPARAEGDDDRISLNFTVTRHLLKATDLVLADAYTGTVLADRCGPTDGY